MANHLNLGVGNVCGRGTLVWVAVWCGQGCGMCVAFCRFGAVSVCLTAVGWHDGRLATTVRSVMLDGVMRWTRGRRFVFGPLVVSLVVLSSCSSTDSDEIVDLTTAPAAAETTVVSTAPATTQPATTTEPTSTTVEPSSTTAAQTTTSTSAPETSPAEDIEAELLRVIVGEREALLDALLHPIDAEGGPFEQWSTAERVLELVDALQVRLDTGTAVQLGPAEATSIIVFEQAAADLFVVVTCTTSDSVVYDVDTGSIIDDDTLYMTRSVTVVREGQELLVVGQRRLSQSLEVPCD